MENCMSSDLSPHRTHPFHHSIPPFQSTSQVCLKPLQMGGIESVECSTRMEWWNGIVEWPHFSHLEGKEASLVSE